jgi:SAM-dependent methyltransferase
MAPDVWLLGKLCRSPEAADYPCNVSAELDPERDPLALLRTEYPSLAAIVAHKRVADFGCGFGAQAMALATVYNCQVVGIDTNPRALATAARLARERGLTDAQVSFPDSSSPGLSGSFDVVVSQNAMEHFPQPAQALASMRALLRPGGQLLLTFGPPWFAPWGAHMQFFCRIPWVNLLFREGAVMTVRARYRSDGARRYEEIESGLNRMTLRKLSALIAHSGMRSEAVRYRGVKGQDWIAGVPLLRELLINQVTCLLTRGD